MAGAYHRFRYVSTLPCCVRFIICQALLFVRLPTPVFPIVVDGSQLKWQTNEHKVDEMVQVRYTCIIFKFALVLVIGLTQCMINGRTIGNMH